MANIILPGLFHALVLLVELSDDFPDLLSISLVHLCFLFSVETQNDAKKNYRGEFPPMWADSCFLTAM